MTFHSVDTYASRLSVSQYVRKIYGCAFTQPANLPALNTRCVAHACELPADVTELLNELPFVGFLVRRL